MSEDDITLTEILESLIPAYIRDKMQRDRDRYEEDKADIERDFLTGKIDSTEYVSRKKALKNEFDRRIY